MPNFIVLTTKDKFDAVHNIVINLDFVEMIYPEENGRTYLCINGESVRVEESFAALLKIVIPPIMIKDLDL